MIIAESKGKVSHPYVQFMRGHKDDIEARYLMNKGILPPDTIEDMRKCYKEYIPYLLMTVQLLEQSSILREAKIEALKSNSEDAVWRKHDKRKAIKIVARKLVNMIWTVWTHERMFTME